MARRFSRPSSVSSAAVRQGAGLIGRGHWFAGLLVVALGVGVYLWQEREGAAAGAAPDAGAAVETRGAGGHAPVPRGGGQVQPSAGTVTHCFDGDSFKMVTAAGEQEVRLWGVDTPEKGQPYAEAVRDFAKRHWEGKAVEVVSDHGQDRYGRRILEMRLKDGPVIQKLLLENGCAWHYRQYAPDRTDFAAAEAAARQGKKGLWAGRGPVPPWEWRKAHPK